MYKSFFGLTEFPFRNNLDSSFFYEKASRLEILQALIYVIKRGDAVIKVTGEVGSGKTTLLRLAANQLSKTFKIVYINSPNLSPKDFLLAIANELEISVRTDIPKYELLQLIRNKLLQYHSNGKHVVMMIDEAQTIGTDTLEELRLLTNLETEKEKLIQLVFFGQQELDYALNTSALRQLKSRITYSIHIPQLTVDDVHDYLNHRMRIASYRGLDFFNYKYAKRIHKLSHGLPRVINSIADQLLMSSFGLGDRKLKPKHFKNLNSLELYSPEDKRSPFLIPSLLFILLVVPIIGYAIFTQQVELPANNADASVTEPVINEDSQSTNVAKETSFSDGPDPVSLKSDVAEYQVVESTVNKPNEAEPVATVEFSPAEDALVVDDINADNAFSKFRGFHNSSQEWLSGLSKDSYVIQLSTSSIDNYSQVLMSYVNHKNIMTNLHFVLALNNEGTKIRIIALYLASDSYSSLQKELLNLPRAIKAAQPFIVNSSSLLKSAVTTSLRLKEMDNHE